MIQIQSATTPKDIARIRVLFQDYAAELVGIDLSFQGFQEELSQLPGKYQAPSGCLLLATVDGQTAGCIAFRKLDGTTCEMKRLYVKPAFRHLKLGKTLCLRLLEQARTAGYRKMVLDTLSFMTSAIGLYRRLGFTEIPPYYPNPLPGTLYLQCDLDAPLQP